MDNAEPVEIVAFDYPADIAPVDKAEVTEKIAGVPPEPVAAPPESETEQVDRKQLEQKLRTEMDTHIKQESERAFEAGRKRGHEEGQQTACEQASEAQKLAAEQRRQQAAELVENFGQARDEYLRRVEEEVVALALAVAARILRREAQMDPLLLTGAVRVALNQLGATTKLRLRVPADDEPMWREAMALVPGLEVRPEIVGVPEMRLGDCVVETELGSVDLGIRAQLSEIERGFFDRAGKRKPAEIDGNPSGEIGQ
jgi:flagellar assembly protein FliH